MRTMAENSDSVKNVEDNKMDITEESSGSENDSDSEDGSSDSDIDQEALNKLALIDGKLSANPYLYDLHVEKLNLLQRTGELMKLREAREAMSKIFPLTEELWLSWIRDEMKVSATAEDRLAIMKLFDRAVADYMSVGVWLEYVQFVIGDMAEVDGIQKIRMVFERAITAVGLHVSKGSIIWEAYREFENAILMGLQPGPGAVVTKEQQNQIDAQTNRVTNLFRRQLAIPLLDMNNTFEEYKQWTTEIDPHLEQTYNRALEKLNRLQPLEDALLMSTPPALSAYEDYISQELSGDEPSRIQCIFERAVEDHCLNATIWSKYVKYLVTKLKVKDVTVKVCDRSIRNCPWDAELWMCYARVLERYNEDHAQVRDIFERALTAGFNEPQSYLRVWKGYCDFMRRKIDWTKGHEEELKQLRIILERAIDFMDQSFGPEGDPDCRLLKYCARLEAKHCHNMPKFREIWAKILQKGFGNQHAAWLEYFSLESCLGDKKHCVKLLQHAVNSVTDSPEATCDIYLSYMAEEGSVEEYEQAVLKCDAQMQRVQERLAKAAEKEAITNIQNKKQRDDHRGSKKAGKKHSKAERRQTGGQVVDAGSGGPGPGPAPLQALQEMTDNSIPSRHLKRKHEDTSTSQTDAEGFKVPPPPGFKPKTPKLEGTSDAPPGLKPKPSSDAPPGFKPKGSSTQPPPGFKGKGRTPTDRGSSGVSGKPSDQQILDQCLQEVKGDEEEESMDTASSSESSHVHQESANDNSTVFVSNLAYDIDENRLQKTFAKVGDIKEIRLIRNAKGKSRGFAYVQFVDEFPVQAALSLDRNQLDGRPMFVSPCEQKGAKTNKFKYATGLEKNKLFVKGLPFTTSKEALETLFSQHGPVKSVRIVTYRSGASKGLAFVEYEDESTAAQAVIKTDGLQIGDHVISVAISNPPERKPAINQRETFTPSLGSGKRDTSERGKARTQLPLLPRSLKKPSNAGKGPQASSTAVSGESTANGAATQSTATPAGMKSNTDFRNMLLSKK